MWEVRDEGRLAQKGQTGTKLDSFKGFLYLFVSLEEEFVCFKPFKDSSIKLINLLLFLSIYSGTLVHDLNLFCDS